MDKCILTMNFVKTDDSKLKVKISDVKPDLTSAEVEALADMIIDKDAIKKGGYSIARYVDSELQTISSTIL